MRILLTGACGTLARGVRRLDEARQHDFVLLDIAEQVHAEGGIRASITDRDAIERAMQGCDAVIHTAALHGAFFGKASNAEFIATNVVGAEYIYDAAIRHGARRVVMASSMEVLIGRKWDAYGPARVDETLPPRADWIYPVTKFQVEALGSFYARQEMIENVQLRYMGFNDSPARKLGPSLLARYVSLPDAARATLLAATRPGLRDETLHIGPLTPLTQKDINQSHADPTGVLERYWPGSARILEQHDVQIHAEHFWPVTCIERARQALGWQPRDTFESYLRELGWNGN